MTDATQQDWLVDPPRSAAQAAKLLLALADARAEYPIPPGNDRLSELAHQEVAVLRWAAKIIENGDVSSAPSWLWEDLREAFSRDTPEARGQAEAGYFEAMRLMARESLRLVALLWRPEAFDRYRKAVVDGEPNLEWMERFNLDIRETIGDRCSASFVLPGDAGYPADLNSETDPVAVIKLVVGANERVSFIIVRPESDPVLTPVTRARPSP